MTKSRKLFVAGALIAGGYGVACFLGGSPKNLGPNGGTYSLSAAEDGFFSALRDFAHGQPSTAPTSQLVPDTVSDRMIPASPTALVPQQVPQQPTWLAATAPLPDAMPSIELPKLANAPVVAESRPIASTETALVDSHAPLAGPKARITNVVSTAAGTAENTASPWDRWPWWDSNSPPSANPVGNHTSAGAAPAMNRFVATPASYDISESTPAASERDEGGDSPSLGGGRTHVVVDGDSLAKLANRYLDDAALGDEIYRLNRDLLSDSELLPIGVELRIPENRVAESRQRFAGTMGLQVSNTGPPAGMVPVEWKPGSFDPEPRAQLLRPIPAGRSD